MMNVDGLATALESGANDVIVKPFDSADLLSRVTQVLGIEELIPPETDRPGPP